MKKILFTILMIVALLFPLGAFGATLNSLRDSFNDNSLAAVWAFWGGTTNAEANTNIEITSVLAGAYGGMDSGISVFDATGGFASVQVKDAGNQALASLEVYPIQLDQDATNNVFFLIAGNALYAYKTVAGTPTQLATVAYNSSTMKYVRIREAGGTTFWQYSANGLYWATLHSAANPITMTAVSVQVFIGTYAVELSTTTVKFDNFNIRPNSGSFFTHFF